MTPDTPPLPPDGLPAPRAELSAVTDTARPRSPLRHRERRRHGWRIAGISAGVLALLLIGITLFRGTTPAVELGTVTTGIVHVSVQAEGLTRIVSRHTLVAPVTGVLHRITQRAGDAVRDGDVVARLEATNAAILDPRTRELAVQRAGAASATVMQLRAIAARAALVREQQVRELDRMRRLEAGGAIAPQQLEIQASVTAQRVEEAVAANAAVHAAEHDVAATRAALKSFTEGASSGAVTVLAPMDGIVLRVLHEDEGVVTAGTPLLEVGDPSSTEVVTDVLSADAARLREGASSRIVTPDGDTVRGQVHRIEPQAFTKRSSLGVDEQRVHVILRPVMPFAKANVLGDSYRIEAEIDQSTSAPSTTIAPAAALVRRGEGWAVFVLRDGRSVLVPVKVGLRNAHQAEIASGVAAGDRVILFPSDDIANGTRVTARPP